MKDTITKYFTLRPIPRTHMQALNPNQHVTLVEEPFDDFVVLERETPLLSQRILVSPSVTVSCLRAHHLLGLRTSLVLRCVVQTITSFYVIQVPCVPPLGGKPVPVSVCGYPGPINDLQMAKDYQHPVFKEKPKVGTVVLFYASGGRLSSGLRSVRLSAMLRSLQEAFVPGHWVGWGVGSMTACIHQMIESRHACVCLFIGLAGWLTG